ncbi:MAG TPA: putative PEP-binding protein, partial [Pirellulales bacterium]
DGDNGLVILQPDEETIAHYRHEAEENLSRAAKLESLRDLPAVTADGTPIELLGNIEFPAEVQHCLDRGSDGIGLYRTEFLYLGSSCEPDEEVHYQSYAEVLTKMEGRPVVIRTCDLGADKISRRMEGTPNPTLGLRSIRLSLKNLPLFRTQLRAVLRSSVLGDLRLMFPLVATLLELRQAKMVLADVMDDLEDEGVPFNRDLPVGMMVEVPAAVLMIAHFVEEVDFISIGTNDLTQYTLAADRSNKDVAGLYSSVDPAVLRLMRMAIEAADRKQVPVNACGQMSGNTLYTMLLLGMGLRRLSTPPAAIPEIKRVCRSVTLSHCRQVAEHVLTMENSRDIKSYLREELKKILPEMIA